MREFAETRRVGFTSFNIRQRIVKSLHQCKSSIPSTHTLWGLRRAGEQQTAVQLPVSLVSVLQWAVLPQAVLVSFD